jgi:5-methylcytosine-specific restriction endonuclease McrA
MRNIPLLEIDDEEVFDNITAAKRQPTRGHLQDVRVAVLTAYRNYENAAPEVGHLLNTVLTEDQSKALIHAFQVKTKPMSRLRGDMLRRPAVARCPFCGIGESTTLDHYLPKELKAQFAIFPKNLVPCCSHCNTLKRDKVLDARTGIRSFLHPYFDTIPQALFVKVNITLRPDAMILRYVVVRPADMALPIFERLQSHFRHLRLADRYRLMALEYLRGQHNALNRIYGDANDADRVTQHLIEQAGEFEGSRGQNYWLTALYRTLAGDRQFCDGGFAVLNNIQ